MRMVFFVLLVCNLLVLAWAVMFKADVPDAQHSGKPFAYANLPSLRLVQAGTVVEQKANNQAQAQAQAQQQDRIPADTMADKAELCTMIGKFTDLAVAEVISSRLKAIDIRHQIRDVELVSGERFWVYLGSDLTKSEALVLLASLQSQDIDSYHILRGELANSISLGVFSRKELAEARVRDMKLKGLEPKIKTKAQTYKEKWIVLAPNEHQKISQLTWQRVIGDDKSLQRRQNFCDENMYEQENTIWERPVQ